jgi:hypothetical protein
MSGDPALGWETRDLEGTRALLEAAGFHAGPTGRMAVPGLALVLIRAAGLDRLRPTPAGGRADASEDGPYGPQLLASTRQAWGPHLLLVPRGPAPAGTSSHAWATIKR